jgi:WD40 repeat protein
VAATPDSNRAITTSDDGTARVWDLATGAELHTLTGHTQGVTAVAATPDSNRAITTSDDGTARIWDLATGTELHTLTGHTQGVTAMAVTPDSTYSLTGSNDSTARIWDLATGEDLQVIAVESPITCAQVSQVGPETAVVLGESSGVPTLFTAQGGAAGSRNDESGRRTTFQMP